MVLQSNRNLFPKPTLQPFDSYISDRINYRVLQLASGFNLTDEERDDYRTAMCVEVYTAMKRFDVRMSKRETFVNRVLDKYVLYTTRSLCNQMKQPCLNPIAFADIGDAFEPTSNDASGSALNETRRLELKLDVDMVISRMPGRLQQAARLLMELSPADAADVMGVHNCSIYRLTGQIRKYFNRANLNFIDKQRKDFPSTADVESAKEGAN